MFCNFAPTSFPTGAIQEDTLDSIFGSLLALAPDQPKEFAPIFPLSAEGSTGAAPPGALLSASPQDAAECCAQQEGEQVPCGAEPATDAEELNPPLGTVAGVGGSPRLTRTLDAKLLRDTELLLREPARPSPRAGGRQHADSFPPVAPDDISAEPQGMLGALRSPKERAVSATTTNRAAWTEVLLAVLGGTRPPASSSSSGNHAAQANAPTLPKGGDSGVGSESLLAANDGSREFFSEFEADGLLGEEREEFGQPEFMVDTRATLEALHDMAAQLRRLEGEMRTLRAQHSRLLQAYEKHVKRK